MKTIFAFIGIGATAIISTLVVEKVWACNPNANCMRDNIVYCPTWKYPRRLCHHKEEELGCAVARKVCQADCSKVNADATNYITQYYAEIRRISSQIKTIEDHINREQEYRIEIVRFQEGLDAKSSEVLDGPKSVRRLISSQIQLEVTLSENNLSSALIDQFIESSKASSDEQVVLLAVLIEHAAQLNDKLRNEISLAKIEDLSKKLEQSFRINMNIFKRKKKSLKLA